MPLPVANHLVGRVYLLAGLASVLGACDYYMERPGTQEVVIVYVEAGAPPVAVADAAAAPDADAPDAADAAQPPVPTSAVGGSVTGLEGTGLVLQNNAGDDIPIGADGNFSFPTKRAKGSAFAVTVKTQPTSPAQTCVVSGGTGTTSGGNVTSVVVNCSPDRFTLGGTISGLSGTGLILQNKAGDDRLVNANGSFAFATTAKQNTTYAVTIKTQPSGPSQTCVVADGAGTMPGGNVSGIAITCTTNAYTVAGSLSGLLGTGLVLQNNGGADLVPAADGPFVFGAPVLSGLPYAVTIKSQPTNPSQTCSVSGGTGTVGGANISSASVNCSTNRFAVSGTASGVVGAGLVLQNNLGDDVSVTGTGTFSFPTTIASNAAYAVSVKTQPSVPTQICSLTNGSGTVAGAAVTDVQLACVTSRFAVRGTVLGLNGAGLVLQNNNGDDIAVTETGAFQFPATVASNTTYDVSVKVQPTGLSQSCTVARRNGTIGGADVTDVAVTCVTNDYTVGGSVAGLGGRGLVLTNAGGDLAVPASGAFTFTAPVLSGAPYAVTIKTQPTAPSQTCTLSAASGTVTNGNITTVNVNCATNTYAIGGTASGVVGTGLVLQDSGGDDLTVNGNGTFAFPAPVASGGTYNVTIKTQPTVPSQTCTVTNGNGIVGGGAVTNVAVSCTTNEYSVGGSVTGLTGSGLVLTSAGNDLPVTGSGPFTFAATVPSGQPFAVSVKTEPSNPSQTCTVSGGSGTVGNGNVTTVNVSCATNSYTVGGTTTGLQGSGLVLQNNGGNDLVVSPGGTFTFGASIASGDAYSVTLRTQPSNPTQTCIVSNGNGVVGGAPVMGVSVSCTTNTYAIGGTMTGITGGTLVLRSGSETISLTAATSFGFLTRIASGAPYAVTVATHPTGQYCQVQNGSGTITTSDITNVTVTCGLVPYATAQLAGGTRRVAFLYVPAGTSIASNAEYKTYCESRGLSQNQNASNGPPFTSAGMSNATAYYCSGYCCYLGVGNSRASGLSAWQNFGLPLATALQVFDRGCGDFNTSYNTGVVTVDSLTIDANGAGSHVANAYGAQNYLQAKSTVFARDGVIVCQEN